MEKDILEELFMELFNVSYLMLDLIIEVGYLNDGDEMLIKFYKEKITTEFTKEELLNREGKISYSCLGALSEDELNDFLESLYC